jgi:hypothetical protein
MKPGDYALAISLVASGQITLSDKLVTHRYAFKDAQAAFSAAHAGKGADGKPVVKVIMWVAGGARICKPWERDAELHFVIVMVRNEPRIDR